MDISLQLLYTYWITCHQIVTCPTNSEPQPKFSIDFWVISSRNWAFRCIETSTTPKNLPFISLFFVTQRIIFDNWRRRNSEVSFRMIATNDVSFITSFLIILLTTSKTLKVILFWIKFEVPLNLVEFSICCFEVSSYFARNWPYPHSFLFSLSAELSRKDMVSQIARQVYHFFKHLTTHQLKSGTDLLMLSMYSDIECNNYSVFQ